MKKATILIFLALMAFAPMAWAQQQFSGGSGTETDPYLISNVDDWNTLADNVGDGNPYDGLYFQMTADIDVGGKMVGKSNSKSFQGIFDGNGHTLTFNKKTNGFYIAPFKYAKNATFKHLHTTGKVQESNHVGSFAYYAGIAGRICGSCNFISCRSSITLDMDYHTSGYDGSSNGNHGGFVGEIDDGAVIFINCLYDGAIDLRNQDRSAGFVGKIDYDDDLVTVNFINCLVAPTSVKLTDCSVCSTYVGSSDNNTSYSFHNCYYRHRIQLQQGIDATGMTNAELIAALGNGWEEVDGKVVPKNMDYYTFTAGDGSSETPYQIASSTDWNNLAGNILMGANYSGKYFQLTQNIEVTETVSANGLPVNMLGVNKGLSFRGTFDGNGHTITINYTDNRTGGGNENYYCGPFRFVNGATIKNLHVAGTIRKTDKKHAGGFVGQAFGTNHIVNCRSSVHIQSLTDGDGSHGGFLGDLRDGTTSFKNCVFDGKLQGTNTKKWGGFVGWVADDCTANFTNCLFVPTLVIVKNDGNKTYARKDGTTNFTNCYYTQTLGGAQGKEACSINCDEHVTVAPDGTEEIGISGGITSYSLGSVAGITLYNPCLKYNNVLYSASGNNVKLNLTQNGATPSGAQANSFIATPGSISGTASPYTLNMPNTNTTISLAPTDFAAGVSGSEQDPYRIYTAEQWYLLADRVNNQNETYSGKFFMLMADITVTETVFSGAPVTMVGINDNNSFQGTFDGNGHTLTLSYNDTRDADFCAPFRYINNATIQYLHVDGTIYKTKGKNAGGLIGKAVGDNTISNCRSSVDIHFDKDGDVSSGGFIGELRESGGTTFTNCLFDGKLRGANAYKWGGFVGWVASGRTATFNNCLFNPTEIDFDINDSNDNSKTFARHDGTVSVNNCYYTAFLNDAQGATDASLYLNEQLLAALGLGWETVVENGTEKVVPIMTVYPLSGDGTEESPYLITSTEDWNHLASNQFMGVSYNGKHFQLTDNISVTRMVGYDLDHAFQGTFDGDGNTITVSYGTATTPTNIQYCAPFKNTYRATIKNLCTAGTIYTSSTHAGGVVGRNGTESLTMTNVKSSVTINSTYSGNANQGGLVGYAINATLEGCVFTGSLLGANSTSCGGLLGWKAYTDNTNATFTDCLFAPTQVTVGTSGSFTIANGATDLVTINNCYYTQALGTLQGKQTHSITAGEYVALEIVGDSTEYDVSGLTLYTVGIKFNDTLYACNEDQVSLNLSREIPEGFTFHGYNVSNGGTISGEESPYTLAMPNADVTVTADYSIEWPGAGTEENPYRIYQPIQLDLLSTRVNNGNDYSNIYFKVMNDIEYDCDVEDNFTAIGTTVQDQFSHVFSGHFDGQGYTISGINSCSTGVYYNGLFGHLGSNAVVKNIVLSNANIGDGERSGGIAGWNEGTVTNCHVTSTVTINGTKQTSWYLGGIVGFNAGSVSHSTFAGTLTKTFQDPGEGEFAAYLYGGIAGVNDNNANMSDNLVIGATIPRTKNLYGAVAGGNGGNLAHNYYVNCTVAGTENATGVGCFIKTGNAYGPLCDITEDDGAVPGYFLTLDENITSDATVFTIPAHGDTDEVTYHVSASGNTITLGYEMAGYMVVYYVNDEAIEGNTFTMPAADVMVSAELLGITKFISGYANSTNPDGGYVLLASPVGTINPENVGNMLNNEFDLYRFNQAADLEWENYKANTFDLEVGKGYLYANSEDVTLLFPGTPYTGSGEVTLSKTDNTSADFQGWNLVGNPFNQIAFIADGRDFYTMNASGSEIEAATSTSIEAMEGVFVIANYDGEPLTFTTTQPADNGGAKLSLNLSHANNGGVSTGSTTAVIDRAIVRFNEGDLLPKFQLNRNSTKVYIPMDGQDYAVVRSEGMGEIPVNFKARENGTYMLSLSSEEVEFSYLHLIDNMTGNDVDLLQTPSYSFNAKTTDYESRFMLVFVCGDANDDNDIAFISNGNIIVNGEGTLQVIDMMGRVIFWGDAINRVSTSGMTPGVYVLRLINGDDVKTQKMVIE